ncbi:MAG: anthranilate synthase component II [Gammaproteobacteria bacterium]
MVFMLDNYDSFTHNLVQYCGELGQKVEIKRNDEITVAEIASRSPHSIIISPGPCSPKEAGISVQLINELAGQIPILGVCLGHQCIAHAYGGTVTHARAVMHGKTSEIHHTNSDIFANLHQPFVATRYHSLIVASDDLPPELEITAWTRGEDGDIDEIMGLKHRTMKLYGVQFHPEAILTDQGHELLANFFTLATG